MIAGLLVCVLDLSVAAKAPLADTCKSAREVVDDECWLRRLRARPTTRLLLRLLLVWKAFRLMQQARIGWWRWETISVSNSLNCHLRLRSAGCGSSRSCDSLSRIFPLKDSLCHEVKRHPLGCTLPRAGPCVYRHTLARTALPHAGSHPRDVTSSGHLPICQGEHWPSCR
jgi:hypothetical protein